MKYRSRQNIVLLAFLSLFLLTSVLAFYDSSVETSSFSVNLKTDYGATGEGTSDDSAKVQKAIDDIADENGGKLIIPDGKYRIGNVNLRSNVHIEIAKGVEITPVKFGIKAFVVFNLGRDIRPIKNVSIRGKGGKFIFKIPSSLGKGRAMKVGTVRNFYIGNFHVEDSFTVFSSIIMSPAGEELDEIDFPRRGTMEDVSVDNAHYGYGLIQAHAAKKVLFRNLKANGGVALRLETGLVEMNDNQIGGVDRIKGENIEGVNCRTAVFLSPHSMKNGVVRIDGVTTKSCAFSVFNGPGFVSKKQTNPNLERGFFAKGSYVKNIDATYGTKAKLGRKEKSYIADLVDELSPLVSTQLNGDGVSYDGPSLAAVGNRSLLNNVKFRRLSTDGFTVQTKKILQLP